MVSWLSLQPRHSFGSRGSRGLLVHKTTRRPQEFQFSRGLLVKSTTKTFLWFLWSCGQQEPSPPNPLLAGVVELALVEFQYDESRGSSVSRPLG